MSVEEDEWDLLFKEAELSPREPSAKLVKRPHQWPEWILKKREQDKKTQQHSPSITKSAIEAERLAKHYAQVQAGMRERDLAVDSLLWEGRCRDHSNLELDELEAALDALRFDSDDNDGSDHCNLKDDVVAGVSGSASAEGPCTGSCVEPGEETPGTPPVAALTAVDDFEELVAACERSWSPGSSPANQVVGIAHKTQCAPTRAEAEDDEKTGHVIEPSCATSGVGFAAEQPMRWTRPAFDAYRRLKAARPLALQLSKRVFTGSWQVSSGALSVKNFPFLLKNITAHKGVNRGCSFFKEEWELSHQVHPERMISIPEPTKPVMPAWNKLPATRDRSPELREVVAGARFASIAFRGELTPEDWAHTLPGSDVLCMTLDLHGDAAQRFLEGEGGDVGKALKRRLLRRLDHRGNSTEVTAAAIWTCPASGASDVRVFIMIQKDDPGLAFDVEREDRNERYWQSLLRHGVQVSPGDMPLWVPREHLAPYLGMTESELDGRWDAEDTNWRGVPVIEEYTPEDGFPADEEMARRRESSHRKWVRFTSQHGLPAWIEPTFIKRLRDFIFIDPEQARWRDRLAAKQRKYPRDLRRCTRAERSTLSRLRLSQQSTGEVCIFRCSPAQFAALAVRDGAVLGEYVDSAHKAGRARALYERIRQEWQTSP